MALALNNLTKVDMPLNKETKPKHSASYFREMEHRNDYIYFRNSKLFFFLTKDIIIL